MRIQTPITGITTTSAYDEGSCYSLVNLRPKNGALHPVPPRKIVQELSQKYDIVFVHQNNDYKNWIGVINDGRYSAVYWDIRDVQPQNIASYINGPINSIQQIGNTLSLITEDNIYYLFYQNNKYTFLGEIPQIPVIDLNTSSSMSHAEYYFSSEYGSGNIPPDNFLEATKGLVNKAIDLLVNGGTDSNGNPIGGYGLQLFDACFIRYAFRLFDGTLTKHSPPILVMPVKDILDIKTIDYRFNSGHLINNESKVNVYGYRIYMNYNFDFPNWQDWVDIIKSVDIFLSPPVGVSNIENIRKDMPTLSTNFLIQQNLIKELTPEALKNVSNSSLFYLVRSIELGKQTREADMLPSKEEDFSKMENLIFQEEMTDDNFSNHKYGASKSYAYNNRLHLGNIKTTFFSGFNAGYFQWGNAYNGTTPPEGTTKYIATEVELYTGTSLEKVYTYHSAYFTVPKLYLSAFISYPDPRAKRITIYEVDNDVWTKVFTTPLESHNLLNLAYYMNEGLKPIIANQDSLITQPDTSKTITLSEPNKIKVSELNNPLNFPNINTYLVGNGTILAMATNAMLVSDRNKGQFPLYVFTTQGIWSLNVGNGEVVYSTLSDPTSQKTPVSEYVCETPRGVIFITKDGLNILNNNQDTFITPHIEEPPMGLKIEMNSHCDGVVFNPEHRGFDELIKDIRMLIYDPHKDEVIINCDSELNYVLTFKSSAFYQSTEKIDLLVGNIYPELFLISDNTLKDYASAETPLTHISFITRPLRYGMPDIKRFERMILRALLYNVTNPAEGKFSLFMVHYSMDGVNFKALTGYPIREGNNKDLDARLMSRSKFSNALFTLAGVISEESKIYYLDTEYEKEYNNTKMR